MTTPTDDLQVEAMTRVLDRVFQRIHDRAQAAGDLNTIAGLAQLGHAGSQAVMARREAAQGTRLRIVAGAGTDRHSMPVPLNA